MIPSNKIARLPASLRTRLNRMLQEGEPVPQITQWLNTEPGIKQSLGSDFDGLPITEADLNEWASDGYLQWEMQQEVLATVRQCGIEVTELRQACRSNLSDQLAICLTAQIAVAMGQTSADLKSLHSLAVASAGLRRGDFIAHRRRLQREKLDASIKSFRAEKAAFKKRLKAAKEGFKGRPISDEERERFHQELLRTF